MSFSKIERHHDILQEIEKNEKLIVVQIADRLNVTPETIRRDLAELELQQLLTRIHGGAIRFTPLREEPVFLQKMEIEKEHKMKIAEIAASRIKSGDTIAIDVGTTTVHIADYVQDLKNVKVVTNSLAAAERFNCALEEQRMTGEIILLGGTTNPAQSSVAGAMTIEWLRKMTFDKAFLSCGGVDDEIVYDYDMNESLVSSQMVENSSVRILLIDSTKIGRRSFCTICRVADISEVICNGPMPQEWQEFEGQWICEKEGEG